MQDEAVEGAWEWYVIADVVRLSAEACEIMGIEPAEAPRTFDALVHGVHPEDRPGFRAAFQRAITDAPRFSVKHRVARRGRPSRLVHVRGEADVDEHTRDVLVSGSCRLLSDPDAVAPEASA
jgi:hypothetical protein